MSLKKTLFFLGFIVFVLYSIPLGSTGAVFEDKAIVREETGEKLDDYLTRITPFGFSGALLVAKDGRVLLNKGYGLAVRDQNIPNTSETVFSTGSITKQFTAAAVMKLEMMGKLTAEDKITQYFKDVPEDKKDITLHHLLNHTAGIVEYSGPDYRKDQREETIQRILKAPLRFTPGKEFLYSNSGYTLLAAIVEVVSGEPYEHFIREHLFLPAAMHFTGYRLPDWSQRVVAHWYVEDKDNGTPLERPYPYWNLLGNGGILSTTEDMLKWHLALLDSKILSDGVKKKIFTPYMNDYGYGWDVLETESGRLIQHDGGSMLGNSAEIRRYLDAGIVTILFCNQAYEGRALFDVVRDKIETLVFGGDVEAPPAVNILTADGIQAYEGTYKLDSGGKIHIAGEYGKLMIKSDDQDAWHVLTSPDKGYPEKYYQELNALAADVFWSAVKGDYEPFSAILFNEQKRQDRVKEFIRMRIDRYKNRTGVITEAVARGTVFSSLEGEESPKTYVELKGAKGSIYFALYWRGKKNIGLEPVMFPPEMSVPFLPASDGRFIGYHLRISKVISMQFIKDKIGSVQGLEFITSSGRLTAKKQ